MCWVITRYALIYSAVALYYGLVCSSNTMTAMSCPDNMMTHLKRQLYSMQVVLLALAVSACAHVEAPARLGPNAPATSPYQAATLKLLTLNMAHGRRDSFNQAMLSGSAILENLDELASVLRRVDADVVALQEADGPSVWSGRFDHVDYLANAAGYTWDAHSRHVRGKRITYGTALLSRIAFQEVISHDFPESPPTLRKGFTLGRVLWQPDADKAPVNVDILSVHLDFSRKSVREQQIRDILAVLESREYPVIILGDFNSNWLSSDSVVRRLAECGSTRVYEPQAINLGTYNEGRHRLDWVLLSGDLDFKRYQVLPDVLSDHRAVYVEIDYIGNDGAAGIDADSKPAHCSDTNEP